MNKKLNKLFDLAYDIMISDMTKQIKIRIEEDYDIISIHVHLGRYMRNKYLWSHSEFCKYLSEKYNSESVHPDTLSHIIIKNIYNDIIDKS